MRSESNDVLEFAYVICFLDGRWEVSNPGGAHRHFSTQQAAIDSAKSAALRDRSSVVWCDREGNRQGSVHYGRSGSAR